MGTTNKNSDPSAENAGAAIKHAAPPRFCASLKVDRITSARLQGSRNASDSVCYKE